MQSVPSGTSPIVPNPPGSLALSTPGLPRFETRTSTWYEVDESSATVPVEFGSPKPTTSTTTLVGSSGWPTGVKAT